MFDYSDSLGFEIVKWTGERPLNSAVINNSFAELQCKFDKSNYGFLQIATVDKLNTLDHPDEQLSVLKDLTINNISVKISRYSSGQIQANWIKNGYAYCLYMNHGIKEISEDDFFVDKVGVFIQELQLTPDRSK